MNCQRSSKYLPSKLIAEPEPVGLFSEDKKLKIDNNNVNGKMISLKKRKQQPLAENVAFFYQLLLKQNQNRCCREWY